MQSDAQNIYTDKRFNLITTVEILSSINGSVDSDISYAMLYDITWYYAMINSVINWVSGANATLNVTSLT